MKKLLLAAVAVLSISLNAQEVKYGAKAGINISSLSGDNTKSKTGFQIGALADFKFSERVSIQPELTLATGGGEYAYVAIAPGDTLPYSYVQKIDLTTINLPIMAKFYVMEGLNLQVGPQLTYVVGDKSNTVVTDPTSGDFLASNYNLSDTSITLSYADGSSDKISTNFGSSKFNIGLNFGAAYEFPMGLFIEGRYNMGLTSFAKNANLFGAKWTASNGNSTTIDSRYSNTQFKNSNIQFALGYRF